MATVTDTWTELAARMREFADLGHVSALLGWDQEVCMALQGGDARARQQATMRVVLHERMADPRLGELLDRAEDAELDPQRAAMVRIMRRDRERALCLPPAFVRRMALAERRGVNAWRVARAEGDFGLYRASLEEVIAVKREQADLIGYEAERYDALLDQYEPGMRVSRLEPLLMSLRDELQELLTAIVAAPQLEPSPFAGHVFADDVQWDLTIRMLSDIGYDLSAGRQDRSAHPFTTSLALGDVRVTTRIDEHNPLGAIYSTIHEAGHGLYEQGFDPAYEDTPIADAPSLGLHESQSRLWENIVGRSHAFWVHYAPVMRELFPEQLAGIDADRLYGTANRVEPSLVRVESDEVTYNMHVLIRFQLELALLREELEAADLPDAWNETYQRSLGVRPPNDALGVMQDIHWSHGALGYFPTYTLGNLYASLLWDSYSTAEPDPYGGIARGEFSPLLSWLRENVHRAGYVELGEDLIRRVTGSGLDHAPFMRYLWQKYGSLYGVARS